MSGLPGTRRWALLLIAFFAPCAAAQPAPPQAQACAACHGAQGNSVTPGTPSIAGQPRVYLENTLVLTREGLRGNNVMQGLLKNLKDPEIIALARHFSAQPVKPAALAVDKALQKRGSEIAGKLRCASCHDAKFQGREQMPRLAAQREDFLDARMRVLRDKPPPGTDTIMSATLRGLPDSEIKALAHFFATQR
jgi:cytochrome c553